MFVTLSRHRSPEQTIIKSSRRCSSTKRVGPIVDLVKLDVYRSCTRQEKREVLETFWRSGVTPVGTHSRGGVPVRPLCRHLSLRRRPGTGPGDLRVDTARR